MSKNINSCVNNLTWKGFQLSSTVTCQGNFRMMATEPNAQEGSCKCSFTDNCSFWWYVTIPKMPEWIILMNCFVFPLWTFPTYLISRMISVERREDYKLFFRQKIPIALLFTSMQIRRVWSKFCWKQTMYVPSGNRSLRSSEGSINTACK